MQPSQCDVRYSSSSSSIVRGLIDRSEGTRTADSTAIANQRNDKTLILTAVTFTPDMMKSCGILWTATLIMILWLATLAETHYLPVKEVSVWLNYLSISKNPSDNPVVYVEHFKKLMLKTF